MSSGEGPFTQASASRTCEGEGICNTTSNVECVGNSCAHNRMPPLIWGNFRVVESPIAHMETVQNLSCASRWGLTIADLAHQLKPCSHYTTFRLADALGCSHYATRPCGRESWVFTVQDLDGIVHTMQFCPLGGAANRAASHLRLKFRKIGL